MAQKILKVEQIARELGLKVQKVDIRGEQIQCYQMAIVEEVESHRVLSLKVLISEAEIDKSLFFSEENFLRLVKNQPLAKFAPKLFKSQTKTMPFWVLREYLPHQESGDINVDFGFSDEFLSVINPEQLVEFLKSLWLFGQKEEIQKAFPTIKNKHIIRDTLRSLESNEYHLGSNLINKARGALIDKSKVVNYLPTFLNHNDLYPDNILFRGEGIKTIDWERCAFNYLLSDAAFLVILAWKNIDWQKEFKNIVIEQNRYLVRELIETQDEVLQETSRIFWLISILHSSSRLLSHSSLMAYKFDELNNLMNKKVADDFTLYLRDSIDKIVSELND